MATQTRARLSPKELLFAYAVAAGKPLSHAYELAGYNPSRPNASHLAQRPHVKAEIERIQLARLETQQLTTDSWRDEVLLYLRDAKAADDLSNRGRALELAGRHLGALDPQSPQQSAAATIIAKLFAQALTDNARPMLSAPVVEVVVRAPDSVTTEQSSAEINGANGAG